MNFRETAAAVLALTLTLPLIAQERGSWSPASKTAQAITGDITFSDSRMTINFFTLTIAEIRPLTPSEISAAFDTAESTGTATTGHLYRLSIPGDKRFLHKKHPLRLRRDPVDGHLRLRKIREATANRLFLERDATCPSRLKLCVTAPISAAPFPMRDSRELIFA